MLVVTLVIFCFINAVKQKPTILSLKYLTSKGKYFHSHRSGSLLIWLRQVGLRWAIPWSEMAGLGCRLQVESEPNQCFSQPSCISELTRHVFLILNVRSVGIHACYQSIDQSKSHGPTQDSEEGKYIWPNWWEIGKKILISNNQIHHSWILRIHELDRPI